MNKSMNARERRQIVEKKNKAKRTNPSNVSYLIHSNDTQLNVTGASISSLCIMHTQQ